MSPVAETIRKAKIRLRLNRFLEALVQGVTLLVGAIVLPAAIVKLFEVEWQPFHLLWVALLALPWAAFALWRSQITDTVASMEVDDRFSLRERISTAWILRGRHEPMMDLVQSDAERHAEGLSLDSRFPVQLPKRAPFALAPFAIFAATCLWLPALPKTIEKVAEAKPAEETLEKEKAEAIAKLLKPKQQDPKRAEDPKAATGEAEFQQAMSELAKRLKDEKLTRKEALSALSNQQKDLQEKKDRLAKLEQARSQLKKPQGEEKFTREARENIASGDYAKAAEAVTSLADQLANGDLSEADIEQLSSELESLSKALDGNVELQGELKKALATLKGSKKGAGGLSPEDAKRLQEALSKVSVNLNDLQRLLERQNELETVLSQIDLAKLAMCDGLSQCKSCGGVCNASGTCGKCGGIGAGAFGTGAAMGTGPGMGGPGRGRGNVANRYAEPEVQMQDENIRTRWQQGLPLGVLEVDAEHSPAFSALLDSPAFVEAGEQEQSVVQEEVPPGYEEIVQGYFDRGQ